MMEVPSDYSQAWDRNSPFTRAHGQKTATGQPVAVFYLRGGDPSLLILRTLQITTIRIAHIALLAQLRRLAVLILLRRRRRCELQLRVCLKMELVVQHAARQARRVLRESDRSSGQHDAGRCGGDTAVEQKFHRRSARVGRGSRQR